MDKHRIEQFSRHILLPEIGLNRQRELKNKSVLIIGLGGLGCIQAIYMSASGVGKIGLADGDIVERTNLQRQILYIENDLGEKKVKAARKHLSALNSLIEYKLYDVDVTSTNVSEIIEQFDIIIDSTDNFAAHYLINDACVLLHKDHVFGSVYRFEGQVSFFKKNQGPCYRCLYPSPPQPGEILGCEAAGVFNHIPGIVGLIQSAEALKYLLGLSPSLNGQLLVLDGLKMEFQNYRFEKDLDCAVCGQNPRIHGLEDYQITCGIPADINLESENEISVDELEQKIKRNDDFMLLDVRQAEEHELTRLPNSILIPQDRLKKVMHEFDTDSEIIVYCRTGVRSARVTLDLVQNGYKKVKHLKGGIREYTEKIDPSLIKY